ncbi:MAG: DUF547 domain-containing protein [Candidatus Binatia bacterium]
MRPARLSAAAAGILLSALSACTAIRPNVPAARLGPQPDTFSHAAFDRVLQRFVDDRGRVDYGSLQAHRADLDWYYDLVAAYSPDSSPALFPTRAHALAYWLNAYNAAVMRTVLEYYPIAGVGDVDPWLPGKAGFFFLQRLTFGGATTSLYYLENNVVRERFRDPRVHFALNCASGGCPRLPRRAFTGEQLDQQLDAEARRFVAEPRNVRIDHGERAVYLSSIFNWYQRDFLDWPPLEGRSGATLLDYVALYSTPEQVAELRRASEYDVRFAPYDWNLNDQHPRG